MSIISIYINKGAPVPKAVALLRPLTGGSISEIRDAIASSHPVYRHELFMNDFADTADTLRAIVKNLKTAGIGFTIMEFDDPITEETLLNILEDSESYR